MDTFAPGRDGTPEKDEGLYQTEAASAVIADAATASLEHAHTLTGSELKNPDEPLDFFIHKDGQVYAGTHLIVDLWNAQRLDDPEHIESSLILAAQEAGATVLSSDFHIFTPNNGVSGVIVLSESHISIHTWPERNFAAVDVFMCGAAQPMKTINALKRAFAPERIGLQEIKRGLQPEG